MLVEDSTEHKGFWTKPRPSVFVLLFVLGALNFFCGPKFFFDLGVQYKERGWTGASRFFMQLAQFSNPFDPFSNKAERYRRCRLPAHDVSQVAQALNIDGYNLDDGGKKQEATVVFCQAIRQYPDFEWPYNNLANIKIEQGDLQEARKLCEQALQINPDYANAHATLADVLEREGKTDEARRHRDVAGRLLRDLP